MGWENGYYIRKRWINNTCKSEYVGSGHLAELIATLDQIEQEGRLLARLEWQSEIEEQDRIDHEIDDFCQQVRTITQTVLLATGHYQHKGVWRKRRMSELTQEQRQAACDLLDRLVEGKGTKQDEKKFSQMLKDVPGAWILYGDISRNAINLMIHEMTGEGKAFALKVSLETGIKQMKIEHGYQDASPLEKMLIEQVLVCWMRLYWVECIFTNAMGKLSIQQGIYWEKRLSANQRRFLRACETLARVRRLASRTPEILQVNIGQNQVNQVAGPV